MGRGGRYSPFYKRRISPLWPPRKARPYGLAGSRHRSQPGGKRGLDRKLRGRLGYGNGTRRQTRAEGQEQEQTDVGQEV